MKRTRVATRLTSAIRSEGFVLLGVLDPDEAGVNLPAVGRAVARGGVDAVLLGGSSGADGEIAGDAARALRAVVDVPVVCYPGNVAGITRHADAALFLSVMNTDSAYWGVEARVLMAAHVRRAGIEVLPTAYIILEPGETAAWVAQARPVPRSRPYLAELCALGAEYSGSQYVLLDSGSRSSRDVPVEIIARVCAAVSIPVFVAGGIATPEDAATAIGAGAHGVLVGGAFERARDPEATAREMRAAMSEAVARRAGKAA